MQPHSEPSISGPAFPLTVKALATALMVGLVVTGWRAGDELATAPFSAGTWAFWTVVVGIIVLVYVWMLTSRTSLTATHISQTWLWKKQVAFADVSQIKLIRVPGLAWLIVPRLVVKVSTHGLYSFPAGNKELREAFLRLARGTKKPS